MPTTGEPLLTKGALLYVEYVQHALLVPSYVSTINCAPTLPPPPFNPALPQQWHHYHAAMLPCFQHVMRILHTATVLYSIAMHTL